MNQDALFFEDFRGAIKHLIGFLGGPKKVGYLLRPALSPKQAENWVNDCMNPDRQTKFDFEDFSLLLNEGRQRGIHCAINQLCAETGYADPQIAPKKTERQRLAELYGRKAAELQTLADELAAIENGETMGEIRQIS